MSVHVLLDRELHQILKDYSKSTGRTLKATCEMIIANYVKNLPESENQRSN